MCKGVWVNNTQYSVDSEVAFLAPETPEAQRFREMVEVMPHMVWLCRADGTPDYANRRWRSYNGLPVGGRSAWTERVHPDERARAVALWQTCLATGQTATAQFRMCRADGRFNLFLVFLMPVEDAHGNRFWWLGTATDISSPKRGETRQRALNGLKDQALAIAAHELRNPLTVLSAGIQTLQRRLRRRQAQPNRSPEQIAADNTEAEMLNGLLAETEQMNILVNDMLTVSQVAHNQFTLDITPQADLTALVERVVGRYRRGESEGRVQLESTTAVTADCDTARLTQVLINLINNGLKYSAADQSVHVGLEARGTEAVIWVRDTGMGIKPSDHSRIFDRFYRLRQKEADARDGLGLGLYISQQIVREHGGRIWLESTPGIGTTFYIGLPLKY